MFSNKHNKPVRWLRISAAPTEPGTIDRSGPSLKLPRQEWKSIMKAVAFEVRHIFLSTAAQRSSRLGIFFYVFQARRSFYNFVELGNVRFDVKNVA
jgi:hypothetical protein